MDGLLTLALATDQELDQVDFKESLDVNSKGEWCEVIKDIVAMANSGGGVLLIGVDDNACHSGFDVTSVMAFDPAKITDKLFSYTGRHFGNFLITKAEKEGRPIVALQIGAVSIPLVFTSSGNYQGHDGKTKTAFNTGVVYFRHGAKSEPGTSEDLTQFLKREIDNVKQSWLSGIRKVVEAPEGSQVVIFPAGTTTTDENDARGVRIADDPNAPVVNIREEDLFHNYPYDYKALTKVLRERYEDFIENGEYHQIRKRLENNLLFCKKRLHNPGSPRSNSTKFYSRAIIREFDRYYTHKREETALE
jgi:Putative DNA-binding domain